ncbi:hypothetical protein RFI_05451 [Reticulomyxa filosa]|uniref:Uncharacterized protein n=1 Tax=Reticulomyxa filosa TaxID=46433 RepID=X6P0K8_RETFI|nr:hypothetical protein RFI_05451 [Reticulomyxa filosa]|eukprot:ETO31668.1 hypothetical protein RFI_05451 [Reticulomyxa filosa]
MIRIQTFRKKKSIFFFEGGLYVKKNKVDSICIKYIYIYISYWLALKKDLKQLTLLSKSKDKYLIQETLIKFDNIENDVREQQWDHNGDNIDQGQLLVDNNLLVKFNDFKSLVVGI